MWPLMLNHNLSAYLRGLSCLGALALTGACHMIPDPAGFVVFPEAHARNLSQLHKSDGSYKYNGVLLGDFGYLVEELRRVGRDETMSPSQISSPSSETIENLSQLLSLSHSQADARALQVQWCARLVKDDDSDLVREICAENLASIGLYLGLTDVNFRPPSEAVTAKELGAIFASLLRELRLSAEGHEGAEPFSATCHEAASLPLDLDGAWRLHSFTAELQALSMSPAARASLDVLLRNLEVMLVKAGLQRAVNDDVDRVAIAGLKGMVQIAGPAAIVHDLTDVSAYLSEPLQVGLLQIVEEHGLPKAGISENLRQRCISRVMSLATQSPSARVRTQGMLCLQALIPEGPRSLREEDWVRWNAADLAQSPEAP